MNPIRSTARKVLEAVRARRGARIAHQVLDNVTGVKSERKALLSFLTAPFEHPESTPQHTNVVEARIWAEVLSELGFQVDVVNYYGDRARIDLARYAVVCGFGAVVERSWETPGLEGTIRIGYANGCYPHFSNHASIQAVSRYYSTSRIWSPQGGRVAGHYWSRQWMLNDLLIVLGNATTMNTFLPWRIRGETCCLNGFYLASSIAPPSDCPGKSTSSRKAVLWFGSTGCIHKGLDVVLSALRHLEGITLHICGAHPLEVAEARFSEVFQDVWPRVMMHGHLAIGSNELNQVFDACSVVIHPSASEGGAASVLTAVAHGGLIPIVSKETGLDLPLPAVTLPTVTSEAVAVAVRDVAQLSDFEMNAGRKRIWDYVTREHSRSAFTNRLRTILVDFVGSREISKTS